MKIDVKLNLNELRQQTIWCNDPAENIWVSDSIARNLIDLLGETTDDFDTVAIALFAGLTYPETEEDGTHKKRDGKLIVKAIKKGLVRKALQIEYDL